MNGKILFILVILFFLLVFQSCWLLPDEELTLSRIPYEGNEFRIDGCYYFIHDDNEFCTYLFFYKNGVTFFAPDSKDINNIDEFTVLEEVKKEKTFWGIFIVQKDTLLIQGWTDGGGGPKPIKITYFKILNDTTLQKGNYLYHFKQFSPKPDSTNVFMK